MRPRSQATAPVATATSATTASPASESIAIDGDPNGLFWDTPHRRLIIADDAHNRLLSWQGHDVAVLAELPIDAGKAGLGQPALDDSGAIFVPRFGHGISGAILRVDAQGHASAIAGVDPTRRRIGLFSWQGRLFETYFVRSPERHDGAVAEVATNGTETDLTTFGKPVGVLAVGNDLFVSDQEGNAVFRCEPRAPAGCARFADVEQPDLL
ncbi:MAG TPA: hypothetical protein VGL13_10165, partial [Polyangiaceae bacterium]